MVLSGQARTDAPVDGPRAVITPLDLNPRKYSRVLVAGGPRSGKTTLADHLSGLYPTKHTDDLIASTDWSAASLVVSTWMDEPGPWLIEGVATPRAIRKWMERSDGKPCDLLLWLDESRAAVTKGQAAMAKGARTVFAEIRAAAQRRGIVVVIAARSDTPAIPEPNEDDDEDEPAESVEVRFRYDLEAATWYLSLPAVQARTVVPKTSVDVRARTAIRSRRRDSKRVPRAAKPQAFETRYRRLLRARAKDTHAILTTAIEKTLKKTDVDERASRMDDESDDISRLLKVIAKIEKAVAAQPITAAELERLGAQLQLFTERAVTKQIESVIAIDITAVEGITPELLDAWVGKNLEIVSSMDAKYFEGATKAVRETVTEGRSTDWLADQLAERYGVAQSRAAFIARDQVGTLNSNITQARQTSLGIEEYTWSTSNDARVRPEHREREGKIFRWDTPPDDEGHAGEPPNCRCGSIPIL